ncbi:MAG: GNAT family N-acetyltransferase, partial [Acidobacteriota bacterium]
SRPMSIPPATITFSAVKSEADWQAAYAIRTAVFVEEQDCPVDEEFDAFDGLDADCEHILGRAGDEPAATARWRVVDKPEGRFAKLERFAILAEFRGGGAGRRLVGDVLDRARAAGHRRFLVHAQAHLQRFYESFGFAVVGEGFREAGIPHVRMTLVESPVGSVDAPTGSS